MVTELKKTVLGRKHAWRPGRLIGEGPMGEVRATVRLTNAFDEQRAARGQLGPDERVRSVEVNALVDTGSVMTAVPADLVRQLGLGPAVAKRRAEYADGRVDYVDMVGPVRIDIAGRDAYEYVLVLGDEVLIGQTVLEETDLWIDCTTQRVVPNPERPDEPVVKVK